MKTGKKLKNQFLILLLLATLITIPLTVKVAQNPTSFLSFAFRNKVKPAPSRTTGKPSAVTTTPWYLVKHNGGVVPIQNEEHRIFHIIGSPITITIEGYSMNESSALRLVELRKNVVGRGLGLPPGMSIDYDNCFQVYYPPSSSSPIRVKYTCRTKGRITRDALNPLTISGGQEWKSIFAIYNEYDEKSDDINISILVDTD